MYFLFLASRILSLSLGWHSSTYVLIFNWSLFKIKQLFFPETILIHLKVNLLQEKIIQHWTCWPVKEWWWLLIWRIWNSCDVAITDDTYFNDCELRWKNLSTYYVNVDGISLWNWLFYAKDGLFLCYCVCLLLSRVCSPKMGRFVKGNLIWAVVVCRFWANIQIQFVLWPRIDKTYCTIANGISNIR